MAPVLLCFGWPRESMFNTPPLRGGGEGARRGKPYVIYGLMYFIWWRVLRYKCKQYFDKGESVEGVCFFLRDISSEGGWTEEGP